MASSYRDIHFEIVGEPGEEVKDIADIPEGDWSKEKYYLWDGYTGEQMVAQLAREYVRKNCEIETTEIGELMNDGHDLFRYLVRYGGKVYETSVGVNVEIELDPAADLYEDA